MSGEEKGSAPKAAAAFRQDITDRTSTHAHNRNHAAFFRKGRQSVAQAEGNTVRQTQTDHLHTGVLQRACADVCKDHMLTAAALQKRGREMCVIGSDVGCQPAGIIQITCEGQAGIQHSLLHRQSR